MQQRKKGKVAEAKAPAAGKSNGMSAEMKAAKLQEILKRAAKRQN